MEKTKAVWKQNQVKHDGSFLNKFRNMNSLDFFSWIRKELDLKDQLTIQNINFIPKLLRYFSTASLSSLSRLIQSHHHQVLFCQSRSRWMKIEEQSKKSSTWTKWSTRYFLSQALLSAPAFPVGATWLQLLLLQ